MGEDSMMQVNLKVDIEDFEVAMVKVMKDEYYNNDIDFLSDKGAKKMRKALKRVHNFYTCPTDHIK
jgi:hypothetical protein